MTNRSRISALLLVLGAACAGAGGAAGGQASSRYYQADQKFPTQSQVDDDALRAKLKEAENHISRAQQAADSGNQDQARAEYAAAADQYVDALRLYPGSEWRMPIEFRTSQLYFQAAQPEKAAELASRIMTDPEANDASKALGAHLAAYGWQGVAMSAVKAGQLEPVRLATADQRQGQPLKPRPPPGAWKRYVDAADTYVQRAGADPELAKPAAQRYPPTTAAQTALLAAEVQYAFDNMEEARKRFDAILQKWPSEPGVAEDAVPLYLNTFLVTKDDEGYRAALERLRLSYAQKAQDKSLDPQRKAVVAKVLDQLRRFEAGAGFEQASALLAQGKPAEAAQLFESIADKNPDSPDAPLALYNASVAWSKAEKPDQAAAAARRLLEKYPTAKVAPSAALALASAASRKGDHKGAAALYAQYLDKYPDAPNRCLALQNVGYEHDVVGDRVNAAGRYYTFGTTPACAKDDPNAAAKALFRAGKLYLDAKQKAKAKEAFTAATQVQGVTDEVAKSQVAEARRLAAAK